jgi:hypothetical protein
VAYAQLRIEEKLTRTGALSKKGKAAAKDKATKDKAATKTGAVEPPLSEKAAAAAKAAAAKAIEKQFADRKAAAGRIKVCVLYESFMRGQANRPVCRISSRNALFILGM